MKSMSRWYDSAWLGQYLKARHFIANEYADRLQDFESAFQPLRTRTDFETTKHPCVLDQDVLGECRRQIESLEFSDMEKQEIFSFGRLVRYGLPFFSEMQAGFTNWLSGVVGEELEPSYNFLSLYNNLGNCPLHMDSPRAKWTLDICIDQSSKWPIQISKVVGWPEHHFHIHESWPDAILNSSDVNFSEFTQNPGDALVFSGSSQWHYRSRIPSVTSQNFAHLIFFHYIPKGLSSLIEPDLWPEIFDIKELAEVVRPDGNPSVHDFGALKRSFAKRGVV